MGIYDREYYRDEESSAWGGGGHSVTKVLVGINVAVFVIDMLFSGRSHAFMYSLALDSDTIREPWNWWRFVTYAFAHDGRNIGHIVVNMFTLWFMGHQVEPALRSGREFLRFYLFAAVSGGLVWSLRNLLLPGEAVGSALVGASGAVVAVAILFALMFPRRQVLLMFIPVPAWVAALILVGLDVLGATAGGGDPRVRVAHDVHLVGAAFAAAYYYLGFNLSYLWPDWLLGGWRNWKWRLRSGPKPRLHTPPPDEEEIDDLEDEADRVLAKLHADGEASLTSRERRILEDYSRRVREKRR